MSAPTIKLTSSCGQVYYTVDIIPFSDAYGTSSIVFGITTFGHDWAERGRGTQVGLLYRIPSSIHMHVHVTES